MQFPMAQFVGDRKASPTWILTIRTDANNASTILPNEPSFGSFHGAFLNESISRSRQVLKWNLAGVRVSQVFPKAKCGTLGSNKTA